MEALTDTGKYVTIKNEGTLDLRTLPVLPYNIFLTDVLTLLQRESCHCVTYYAFPAAGQLKFICCLADDSGGDLLIFSHEQTLRTNIQLISMASECYALHIFEREISENFGVVFINSPWDKPVRYAYNRADRTRVVNNYPFYKITSEELHEVGVGPIHAGVIEPGHFRFLCNGETVLHLEIQLGWQHRGIENTYLSKPTLLQRTILSESIAADTAVGHSMAFINGIESLGDVHVNDRLKLERTLGLELERIAIHVGDLGNLCIGLAYQLGASVFGALRTPLINFMQSWCGNRFGKGLIRAGGSHYPLDAALVTAASRLLDDFEARFQTMANKTFALPSALMRLENIGTVSRTQMQLIGAVGMAARMTGMPRDIRQSHPFAGYRIEPYETVSTITTGDVWARALLRKVEIEKSILYIRALITRLQSREEPIGKPISGDLLTLKPQSLTVSLVEGWRGEICHSSVTDEKGKIVHYKVKDPSIHNWMALALSLRNLEISDFPINNKSYNLSYCGHDL